MDNSVVYQGHLQQIRDCGGKKGKMQIIQTHKNKADKKYMKNNNFNVHGPIKMKEQKHFVGKVVGASSTFKRIIIKYNI